MASAEHVDVIVTAWQAGHISYVEAVRRLLDLGVSIDDAIKRLATVRPAAHDRGDEGSS